MEIINATDGYKLGHHRMYPEGTEQVYSNWTPRSNKYFPEATEGSVVFGIQYLIKRYLIDEFNKNFFGLPKEKAVEMFYRRVHNFVGIESVGYKHIEALYDLGYLPIRIKALPEGSVCPIRVPMMTITNTKSEFFWLTNYLETLISCTLWMPCTSATRARLYKKELKRHAVHTGFPEDVNLDFLCHDFSMRGMAGLEAAIISGMAHMTSFVGSETIPAIAALEEYYGANSDNELIAATVPATEHSVMCAGGEEDELQTFKRLINELYPSGFVSIVSDTWDFWNVIENFLPKLKKDIMARDGRVVIRPDSGDPVDIICGLRTNPHFHTRMKEGKYYCCYAPFSLKVVCSILNTMNYRYVMILEPHSERTKGLLGTRCYPQKFNFESHLDIQSNIVFPDAGAYQRYKILSNNWGHIVFNKVRDLETGKIKEFSIGREVNCPTFTFIDDLCDAGGTFLGELKVLKERYPDSKFEIIVCHAVNIEGLVKLCNNFDRVIITNSYCDYGYKPSNNNLTVIDVCG